MIRDPALRFWVDYVEAEGALCEAEAETAELILPLALQRAFGLPETLTVTSDPDVADDGALLLAIGHSALDAAAARVLERGDVGRAFLARPPSSRASRETLLAHARAAIGIDHGRIDAERDPVPVYYPLLRVGALVTYTLDDQFQECEDVWVDGCAGHVVSLGIVNAAWSNAVFAQRETGIPLVQPDLRRAVAAAHASLDERAARRALALERQAQLGLRDEQQRAESYYDEVLAALEQRRAAAPPERRPLLEARAEATELERHRRLREIAAKFDSSRTVAPYRLNLLFAPALAFAVDVRRGERRYPFMLHWLVASGCFAPLRCPNCDAVEPLVAGRTQLGCRRCAASGLSIETQASSERLVAGDGHT
jgi:hypothetical protein